MHYVVATIGTIVSIGLIAVSVMMNIRFGQTLGKTELDGLIYSVASACADGFKVILPFTLIWGWNNKRYITALVSVVLFGLFSAYSVTSSLGFSATNRAESSGKRQQRVDRYNHLKGAYDRTLIQRNKLRDFRPEHTLRAFMTSKKQHTRWKSTSGCTDVTVEPSHQFCKSYYILQAELAVAQEARKLDEDLRTMQVQLRQFWKQTNTVDTADPQILLLTGLSGLTRQNIEFSLTLLLTALVELGSGFGLFVTFGHGQSFKRRRVDENADTRASQYTPPSQALDKKWAHEYLTAEPRQFHSIIDLYKQYKQWCIDHVKTDDIMTLSQFKRLLAETEIKNNRYPLFQKSPHQRVNNQPSL